MRNYNKLFKYFIICLKLQCRQYIAIFFSLFFPIILTIVFVSGLGRTLNTESFNFIDKYFFVAVTLSIVASTTLSIPLSFSFDLKLGYLKQLKLLNVNPIVFKFIDVVVSILMIYAQILILLSFSYAVYGLKIVSIQNVTLFLILLLPGIISISFLGTEIALLLKKPESYMPIGITFMMLLLALSGCLGFDPATINNSISNIYKYLPSYYLANPMYNVWNGLDFPLKSYFLSCSAFLGLGVMVFGLTALINKKRRN